MAGINKIGLRWFRNLGTARKLLIGFLLLLGMMVLVGQLALGKLAQNQERLDLMYGESLKAVDTFGQVETAYNASRLATVSIVATDDSAERERFQQQIGTADAAMDDAWSEYQTTDMTGRQALVDEVTATLDEYRKVRDGELVPLALAGDRKAFNKVRKAKVNPLAENMAADLDTLGEIEQDAAAQALTDSQAAYSSARAMVYGLLVAAGLLGIALAFGLGRLIARPLRRTVEVLQGLASGRLDARLELDTRDEVGQMATALNTALDALQDSMGQMGQNATALAAASEELSAVSSQMTGSATESASQADRVSSAAEQVTRNVQTVATGTEEMSASIREISQSATSAAGVAAQAVEVAKRTGDTVVRLGESSADIGKVITVINSIAEQTNLLALNATIEAARAGEAGKGFAVVANEVKELAQSTARATEDISGRIEGIQSETEAAVAAITQIAGVITQINDSQATIASAVEEQTATTNEMARNVSEAASGSADIAGSITTVARTAGDAGTAAQSTNEAAEELARMAAEMQRLVARFQY